MVAARGARWTLTVLTVLNFLNYVDRYVLAPVVERLKHDPIFHGASDADFGLLQTSFLWAYLLVAPLAGLAGRRLPRKYLVAAGVAVWSVATVWSGLARSYPEMMAARALIGVGEASYATVAPTILSDLFSRERRARMLAIFYLATPVGSALGFLVGGWVAQAWGWRYAFFLCGGPGLLFAFLALGTSEPVRGAMDGDLPTTPRVPVGAAIGLLLGSRDYLRITFSTTAWVFAVGAIAFWLPTYYQEVRGLSTGAAGSAVGAVAVGAGLLGTLAGGWIGDAWARRDAKAYLRISGLGLVLAAPLALANPYVPSLAGSLTLVFFTELLVFLNTGPLNTALINSMPPSVREVGLGLHVMFFHMFGDAISPPLFGALNGALQRRGLTRAGAFDLALATMALPLLLGGALLLAGLRRRVPD